MDYEKPLTSLVWLTSIISVIMTYIASVLLIRELGDGTVWWKLATIITCGTLAGAIIPELVKIFTSTNSQHVGEVVASSREGGASLNILSGLTAGNFSAFWMGLVIVGLMGIAYGVAVDFGLSAGQSSLERGKHFLEENDGAGNTFKATAKPVLIGTAVVGATTLIFSIIMLLTDGLTNDAAKVNLSLLYPPFLLGLITGGAVIYWFTGASTQAVVTGAYRAVEFIKANIRLDSTATSASIEDSKRVVAICTQYAQRGMFNIFLAVFFITLAFACLNEYFFIGYLISIAIFGLYQAIFMANAGGAWDNAKKIVEVNLREKGTPLHAATVVGDTVGDPFKDTSSVALNPIIKFTTLFGLLAVELAIEIENVNVRYAWAGLLFVVAVAFVWRSFYGMRISSDAAAA
jgi:K(+)-stimulated pyrophosphate-energized sodium pump